MGSGPEENTIACLCQERCIQADLMFKAEGENNDYYKNTF